MHPFRIVSLIVVSLSLLTGCDRLGIADPAKEAAQKESDAKAIGGACRHAGRAIEDCYALNPEAARAAVFAGWKEMNDYMRENKIDTVKPEIAPNQPPVKVEENSEEGASESASASASGSASASAKSKK